MFCIKSDVITLESIKMYGFVTAWTSMDDGPYWVILLMYESHEMRHTGFPQSSTRPPGRCVTCCVNYIHGKKYVDKKGTLGLENITLRVRKKHERDSSGS